MPLPSITSLSDDEAGPKPPAVAKGDATPAVATTPAEDPPVPTPKAKSAPKKDKTVKTPKAKAEPVDKQRTGSSALKRPAAAKSVLKKPAASSPSVVKAYKYMYHKEGKYGIKFKGHEVMTAFASNHV